MRKIFAAVCFVAAMLIVGNADAQLLYKISGKKLKQPSYIVGTMHLAPGSFAVDINGMADAMSNVQQVIGEVALDEMDEMQSAERQAEMMEKMRLPNGMTLKKLLTKEQYGKLNDVMMRTLGVNMKTPALAMQLYNLTPSALAITLTQVVYLKQVPGFNPADQLDMYFQRQAMAEGKKVGGLESADFQMEMLYSQDSLDEQVKDLMCFLDEFENSINQTRRLMQAYYSQDIDKIAAMVAEMDTAESDCGTGDEAMDALLNDRNGDWIKQMPKMMKKRPTLFVVGCAHLVGEKGVLQLLRDKGYTVEPIEPTKKVIESSTFRLEVRPRPQYFYYTTSLSLDEARTDLIVPAAQLAKEALENDIWQKNESTGKYRIIDFDWSDSEYRFIVQFKKQPFDYRGLADTMVARGWVTVDTLPSESAYLLRIADTARFLAATQEYPPDQPHVVHDCYTILWKLQKSLPVMGDAVGKLWQRDIGKEVQPPTNIDEAHEWLRPFGMELVPAGRGMVRYHVYERKNPFEQ